MKYLKMLGLAALAAMAFAAFAASSASATTLEVNGVKQNGPVTLTASLETGGGGAKLARTDGSLANTCTVSHVHGVTTSFTNPVTGPLTGHTAKEKEEGAKPTDGLSFGGCTNPVTVHDPGTLYVEHENVTDGTVFSEGAEVTVATSLGFTVTCTTGGGTKIGTLTGATNGGTNKTQHATIDIDAVLNCGFLLPSATWKGSYEVTTPTELGVVA